MTHFNVHSNGTIEMSIRSGNAFGGMTMKGLDYVSTSQVSKHLLFPDPLLLFTSLTNESSKVHRMLHLLGTLEPDHVG
jgi:hypothetical protein